MYALQLLDDDAEEVFVELLVPQRELRALFRRARGGVEAREQPCELEPAVEGVVGGGHGCWCLWGRSVGWWCYCVASSGDRDHTCAKGQGRRLN